MSDIEVKPEAKETLKRDRSPKFPYIGLGKAIERTEVLYSKVKRYEARVADIAKDWDLSPKSSSTDRTVAALQSFGLVEDSGSGDNRKIKLSELGARIIADQRPGVRDSLMAEVALKPPIILEYARRWGGGRPDDAHALSQLQFEGNFTEEGARMFLRVFDETIRFASIAKPDNTVPDTSDKGQQADRAKVGDFVQVEIDGVLQFTKPVQVRAVQEHEGHWWAFVQGSETGLPMEQIKVVEKGSTDPAALAITPPTLPLADVHSALKLTQGEREWLRGPLSKDTSYRLVVTGELGPKEIGKLIKVLQAQKDILTEDDEDSD